MLEKLKFWKKKEDFSDLGLDKDISMGGDFGMPKPPEDNLGLPPSTTNFNQPQSTPNYQPSTPIGFNQQPTYQPPQHSYQQPTLMGQSQTQVQNDSVMGKNIEIVSYKLDALKAALDSINQRLANIERVAYQHNSEPSYEPQHTSRKGW
jgi:hypothetical protein